MKIIKNVLDFLGSGYGDDEELIEESEIEDKIIRKNKNNYNFEAEDKQNKVMRMFSSKKDEGKGEKVSSVSIIRPKHINDGKLIADAIREGKVVTFSLELLDYETGRRVVDFVTGSAYTEQGSLMNVTDKVIAYIPRGIEFEEVDTNISEGSYDFDNEF